MSIITKQTTAGFRKLKKDTDQKGCFYDLDDCSEEIIRAHSIQNNRILKKLSIILQIIR